MGKIVIYHKNCLDGFGAAWSAWKALGDNVKYIPAEHGNLPPEVDGEEVYIVDFSYKREFLDTLVKKSSKLVVLDHHKTALPELEAVSGIEYVFDLERSGCGITWEYFHNTPVPDIVKHIQDYDLWKFELDGTKEVTSALRSYAFEFEIWNHLMGNESLERLKMEGKTIERYRNMLMEQMKENVFYGKIAGHEVPIINCGPAFSSDLLGDLSKGNLFAAGYSDLGGGKRKWQLRSNLEGLDVSEIAESYGGGGHRNAAGFLSEQDWNIN